MVRKEVSPVVVAGAVGILVLALGILFYFQAGAVRRADPNEPTMPPGVAAEFDRRIGTTGQARTAPTSRE